MEINIFLPESIDNPDTLGQLEKKLDLKFTSAKWYLDWSDDFTPEIAQGFVKQNTIPELVWQPQINGGECFNYKSVISGSYDGYLNRFAKSVRDSGASIRINLAPEMNGQWAPWGIGNCDNSADDFKSFWQYTVGKFRAQKVDITWIWAPNIHHAEEKTSYADIFPGDDYIDFMGLEGYNWGTTQSWSTWQSFKDVFASSYNDLTALSGKDIIITEFASTEQGGDKAQWIKDMFSDLQTTFPRISGITWFNINKETDWRIDSSPASETAFRQGAQGFFTTTKKPTKDIKAAEQGPSSENQNSTDNSQSNSPATPAPTPSQQKKYAQTRKPLPLNATKMVKSASDSKVENTDSFRKLSYTFWAITDALLITIIALLILTLRLLRKR